jgi:lysophospholipase L1-like esterase
MKNFILFTALFFCLIFESFSQQNTPYYLEIETFKKADSLQMPLKNGILFVGSSSLRMWKDLETTYKTYNSINRGFGGSNLEQAIYYADDIIFPYQPKQIVIYSGENDIAEGTSPEITFDRFKILFKLIRKKLPEVFISYISVKPSVSREKWMPQMIYTNELIKSYLSAQAKTSFIDVYHPMLQPNGKPMNDIFLADNLHMNSKGYEIWKKAITPFLIK